MDKRGAGRFLVWPAGSRKVDELTSPLTCLQQGAEKRRKKKLQLLCCGKQERQGGKPRQTGAGVMEEMGQAAL